MVNTGKQRKTVYDFNHMGRGLGEKMAGFIPGRKKAVKNGGRPSPAGKDYLGRPDYYRSSYKLGDMLLRQGIEENDPACFEQSVKTLDTLISDCQTALASEELQEQRPIVSRLRTFLETTALPSARILRASARRQQGIEPDDNFKQFATETLSAWEDPVYAYHSGNRRSSRVTYELTRLESSAHQPGETERGEALLRLLNESLADGVANNEDSLLAGEAMHDPLLKPLREDPQFANQFIDICRKNGAR